MASTRVADGGLPRAGRVVAEAHVERLAVLAALSGVKPPPVDACRVLELGMGSAGQLLPLAIALPSSHFVAVESSERELLATRRELSALAIGNVELWAGEIGELPASLGSFDYVIVHGTRCWTSPSAREATLRALARHLSATGVGYVSFNSYPGCLAAQAAQHLLDSYVSGQPASSPNRLDARHIAELLGSSLNPAQAQTLALKLEFERLARCSPAELADAASLSSSTPLDFQTFAGKLSEHGLVYFAEAVPGDDDTTMLSAAARAALGEFVTAPALWQQSLDLYSGRVVRHALVRSLHVTPSRAPLLEAMRSFVVGCAARLELRDGELRLESPSGAVAQISEPAVSRAFVQLSRSWPEFSTFSSLVEQVSRDEPALRSERERGLAEQLHRLFKAGVVELRPCAPRCTARPGERPLAHALARRMADVGDEVVNQHQRWVRLPDADTLRLLTLCDGNRTRHELLAHWTGAHAEPAPDLDAALARLARLALLLE